MDALSANWAWPPSTVMLMLWLSCTTRLLIPVRFFVVILRDKDRGSVSQVFACICQSHSQHWQSCSGRAIRGRKYPTMVSTRFWSMLSTQPTSRFPVAGSFLLKLGQAPGYFFWARCCVTQLWLSTTRIPCLRFILDYQSPPGVDTVSGPDQIYCIVGEAEPGPMYKLHGRGKCW